MPGSSPLCICFPHFFNDSDLFHEQAGAFTGKTRPLTRNGKVLTRAAANDDVHRFRRVAAYPRDVAVMLHDSSPHANGISSVSMTVKKVGSFFVSFAHSLKVAVNR